MSVVDLPPVSELLPHAGPMVFLSRVLEHQGDITVCEVPVGHSRLLRDADGGVPSWVGIEYMAQCIAAHSGLLARARGEAPSIGYLLGTRRLTFHVPAFRSGQTLAVRAHRVWGRPRGMATFACSIDDASSCARLAEGRINCFVPPADPGSGGSP